MGLPVVWLNYDLNKNIFVQWESNQIGKSE